VAHAAGGFFVATALLLLIIILSRLASWLSRNAKMVLSLREMISSNNCR
jgi:hypothetical protein